ncbi:MAG: hypothetical protein ABW168_15780, partial [Sedimenticola sp.]
FRSPSRTSSLLQYLCSTITVVVRILVQPVIFLRGRSCHHFDTHRKESGNPTMQQLLVGGGSSDENRRWDKRLGNRSSSPPIWLFLITITAAIGGWWLFTWSHSRGFAKEAEQELSAFVFRGFLRIMEFITWLGPIRRLQR